MDDNTSNIGLMNLGIFDGSKKRGTKKSMKGLRGGGVVERGMGESYKEGGSVCMAGGGMVTPVGTGAARSKSCKVS